MDGRDSGHRPGRLSVVGTGPGSTDHITPAARQAIEQADVVAGYRTYIELIHPLLQPEQEVLSSTMMQEVRRCGEALKAAEQGKDVALICSGDPGIYAMAGLVFELALEQDSPVEIVVVPGIASLNSCASLLGAPLMHDFAVISLSDLLTPWELIEKRLQAAAEADFVTVLYNPKSKKRASHIDRARDIFLKHRHKDTPVGIVTGAMRDNQAVCLTTLAGMGEQEITMQSTVIIGNSTTFTKGSRMITPRGYRSKYDLGGSTAD